MKKHITVIYTTVLIHNLIMAHCQVPCGIYDDVLRIIQIKEDLDTIKKAIIKIKEISKYSDEVSHNQLIRWVTTKEEHASNIQKIVSNYFLTQRIKETNQKYIDQTTTLQRLLVVAMKCKQNLEEENVNKGLNLVTYFSEIYFDSHGLEHLEKMEN